MKYKQREIVLIPFPYTDLSYVKKRPVLIISNDDFNSKYEDVVILAITSNQFVDKYSVIVDTNCLEYGIMPETSVIKISRIFTIHKDMIIKKFSQINKNTYSEVIEKLKKFIEISE